MNPINITKLFSVFTIMLLVFSLSVVLKTHVVFACSCNQPGSPLTSLHEAKAVFAGRVTDIDIPYGVVISSADSIKVTFNVLQSWKGPIEKNITVSTAREGASCGFSFETRQEYLVYAYGNDNDLRVSLCSRTSLLAQAGDDLSALGQGKTITGEPKAVDKQLFNSTPTMLIVGGLILVIVLLKTIYRQRKT